MPPLMHTPEHIAALLLKDLSNDISSEEREELQEWVQLSENNRLVWHELHHRRAFMEDMQLLNPEYVANGREQSLLIIKEKIAAGNSYQRPAYRIHLWRTAWLRYAAAILLFAGIGAYLWNSQKKGDVPTSELTAKQNKNDVLPGSNRAMLTLSDGRVVKLTPETASIVEAGMNINNTNGRLEYGDATKAVFNTMTTPRGGQYQLTLADGTTVWLNAASSITYPTAFVNNTREVTVVGEAYFEVKKNSSSPFIVKTPKEKIIVLGTSFNVNAYPDEPVIKTSLLEGAVKVGEKILKPGQACINNEIVSTNVHQDIAWKNGFFAFADADIKTMMRQLGRWYDVEVHYEGNIPKGEFTGDVGRNLTLSQLLRALSTYGFHYRIEKKKIIISE